MQLFISFLLTFNLISVSNIQPTDNNDSENESTVVIEIQDANKIPFDFTMEYNERRQIIKIRSGQPIKSLRTVEKATNRHKGYNVLGSDLIILPQKDFAPGSYIAEIKFQNDSHVVMANIHVVESAVADGQE